VNKLKSRGGIHSTHMSHSPSVLEAVMRATGILALMGIAVVHLVQLVPTFEATPLLGGAFVLLIAGAVAVAARLISSKLTHAQLWLPVAALGVAAIGGYVFTRVVSTPLDNQDVGNWACMLGIAALFVEGMLVALSAYALSTVPRRRLTTLDIAEPETSIGEPASRLVRVHANGSGS
jgi:uncharacterized membrane protein YeiB